MDAEIPDDYEPEPESRAVVQAARTPERLAAAPDGALGADGDIAIVVT